MSWAEVKKLNSDLSTPLNLASLINHIDLVGSNYVGYGDVDGTVALLSTDAVYAHEITKTILGNLVVSENTVALAVAENNTALQKILNDDIIKNDMATAVASYNDVALAVAENNTALQKILNDVDIKEDMANAIKDYNDVASEITANAEGFKQCISDTSIWAIASQNSILPSYCETKLVATSGVGEWLAFLADSDNATLIACDTMNAVADSETAMNVIVASGTAMTAIVASETAINAVTASETAITAIVASGTAMTAILSSDQALYSIAVNNDTSLDLSKLASGIEGMATTAWENDTKWDTIKTTLDASSLFTKSGLITDVGGTKNRTGNLITLIQSAYAGGNALYKLSITPRYAGCYAHTYTYGWSTGKHIMWGGHSSTHQPPDESANVKHYMYTPII